MIISEIKEKEIWENFLLGCAEKTFLDSWNWGEFQELMGNKIWRLGVFDKEKIVGVALISKIKAKRGTFLLIQHGPIIGQTNQRKEIFQVFLEELKKKGKEEGASFIRMNPLWERNQENQNILRDLGFKEAPMHANAYEATWRLEITLSEEELISQMRKTTRYLIRQAMKNPDITIEKSEKLSDIEIYQKLNKEMAERQKFVPFSSEYIKNEFEIFSKDKETVLFLGKYKGEIDSAALVIFWSGVGFYHQAASLARYVKFSIPYLLQWEAIKEAKNRGCILYDFWGFVDPRKNPRHPWAGPTLFKMGFGGRPYEYVKTQDFPLSPKYWLTFIFEKMRKIKRGL
ncbi:MAG: peptidoglycan bridge formation glycyltransferase FemA/FemB family protein [bacterium]|nr:peptidoglycan bridge formation glycyltransferase FemA/FemB family protein [bacterium]